MAQADKEFLNQVNAKIAANISNENFGVTELADAMNMSRSNLLRKVKKASDLSVSQLISQVRLQKSMELLRTGTYNVSEVAVQVGFSSTSYFIKCFREHYGYPPGEVNKRLNRPDIPAVDLPPSNRKQRTLLIAGFISLLVATVAGWFAYPALSRKNIPVQEKAIVVLPFKNESNDTANVYLVNGLMEAVLNNLQKIKSLKVISRTSAEKYRGLRQTIPEMARELNVNYFVEGSGQKIGNRLVLNVQLIDASDRQLWSRQYRREVGDIFALQQDIATDIVEEVQVFITPDEKNRLEKPLTQNTTAFTLFLKGLELLNKPGAGNFPKALSYFQGAIAEDKTFAMAYACASIACYYIDIYQSEKPHLDTLGTYADMAMRLDPTLSEGYTAKGMYFLLQKEYSQALPYLEKGLEYNPNSTLALSLLADFYGNQLPNTGKYLEYALRGLRLGAQSGDSVAISNFHLRLANALIQNGFADQALEHVNRSLDYYPENAYSRYLRAFTLFAKNGDLNQTRDLLAIEFRKDTMRIDILQEIGKVSYYLQDFDSAYQCYKRFNYYREKMKLDIYRHEDMTIAMVYAKVGLKDKANEFIRSYRQYLDTDPTAYKNLGLAMYYSRTGDAVKALEHLQLFAKEDNIQYWIVLFLNKDPLQTTIERSPEFQRVVRQIEERFWANHEKLKHRLEEKGLL
ncbi:MAG: helix-turn-helix domain-containing protein [Flammeovirgaceae bacterium]|nr:MAG: helix-turn-helix domain-containing protein [Flammeovirgaceae bacterium]